MLALRPTVPADLPAVVEWERDRDTARWLGDTGPSWHRRALDDPAQTHLLAVERGTPVGFVVLVGLGEEVVELRRVVVAPGRRGAGRGRALLRAVIAHANTVHRAADVWLDVRATNHRARALYASEGFTVTHEIGTLVFMRRQNGSGIQRCESNGGRS